MRLHKARERSAEREEALRRETELSLLRAYRGLRRLLDVAALLHDVTRRLAKEMNIERAALVAFDEQREAGFIIASSDDAAERAARASPPPEIPRLSAPASR